MRRPCALVTLLLATFLPAMAGAQVHVGILSVALEGEVPADLATSIERSVTAGLAARGLEVTGTRALARELSDGPGDLAACGDALCLEDLGERAGIQAGVRVSLRGALNIYAYHLEAVSLAGRELTAVDAGCDICNVSELGRSLEESARQLADDMPRTTAVVLGGVPAGARIEVDGERVRSGPLTLRPGVRVVTVLSEGREPVTRPIEVRLGEPLTVDLSAEGGGDGGGGDVVVFSHPRRRPNLRAMTVSGWVLLAGGAAAIVGGVVNMSIHHMCAGGDRNSAGECERHFETLWLGVGLTAGGVAVAATGLTLVLLARAMGREPTEVAGHGWLTPGPAGSSGLGYAFAW